MTTTKTTEIETVSLCSIDRDDTTLQASLDACQAAWEGTETIALLYSPKTCQFARLSQNNGSVHLFDPENQTIELFNVFEARVFNENAELRWLNQSGGLGRAVLLWEESSQTQASVPDISVVDYEPIEPLTDLECLNQEYVLWGEGWTKPAELGEGWSRLTQARIGSLDIPYAGIQRKQSAVLKVCEYLKADDYGNLSVVEERLLGLGRT